MLGERGGRRPDAACRPGRSQSDADSGAVMATVYTRSTNPMNPDNYLPQESHPTDSREVNFSIQESKAEEEERRKYLTAKYGAHQMRLIRKRLAVEDWLDKELRKLYDTVSWGPQALPFVYQTLIQHSPPPP